MDEGCGTMLWGSRSVNEQKRVTLLAAQHAKVFDETDAGILAMPERHIHVPRYRRGTREGAWLRNRGCPF